MAKIKKILKILFILYVLCLMLGSGYYLSHCSCTYKFFLLRPRIDCSQECVDYEPLTNYQQVVNLFLLKK